MKISHFGAHHLGVEHRLHPLLGVVDEREGRDRAGHDTQDLPEKLGAPEGEARRVEPAGKRVEIERAPIERDDEPERLLLVLDEKRLAVRAGKVPEKRVALRHRGDRRVLDRRGLDAERLQAPKQLLAGGGHGEGRYGIGRGPKRRLPRLELARA